MPTRASESSAGFEIAAAEAKTIPAGRSAIVMTGLSLSLPDGTFAKLAPRSMPGMFLPTAPSRAEIEVEAALLDYDNHEEVGVSIFNRGQEEHRIASGDPIAQIIIQPVSRAHCLEVHWPPETDAGRSSASGSAVAEQPREERGPSSR
jgi:dUTP pyrophosphatase